MATCEVCGMGPAPEQGGITVHRQNKPGEMPARWRCSGCNTKPIPDHELLDVLERFATEDSNG
jgi:hypothetical protein